MKTILVFGAYGLVGASLCPSLELAGYTVVRQGRRNGAQLQIDPNNYDSVIAAFRRWQPSAVVNLIAATNVDACESDPQMAYCANVHAVEVIAKAANCMVVAAPHLIQISSDQVYDGAGPHVEAEVKPCNVYALSKYAGELVAGTVKAAIIRTNVFGRSKTPDRTSFSDWIVNSLRSQKPIVVFDDVLFSPLHFDTLADVVCVAIERGITGVVNAGTRDGLSKAEFAFELSGLLGLDQSLMTIGKAAASSLRARRPIDMRLNCERLEALTQTRMPELKVQIHRTALEYQK